MTILAPNINYNDNPQHATIIDMSKDICEYKIKLIDKPKRISITTMIELNCDKNEDELIDLLQKNYSYTEIAKELLNTIKKSR